MPPKRAYSYIRVSTIRQEQRGFSIPAQENDNKSYCQQQGYHIVDTFTDAESGTKFKRKELDQVIEDAAQGLFDVLIIPEIDRITRAELRDFLNFEHQLKQHNVTIEYSRQPFLQEQESDLYKNILALMAHDEINRITKRMYTGKRQKARGEKWIGTGKPPFGYDKEGSGHNAQLVINDTQANVVRDIFTWYAYDHLSVIDIARRLTERKIPTPAAYSSSYTTTKSPPDFWVSNQVYAILNRRAYMGEFENFKFKNIKVNGKTKQIRRPPNERILTPCPPIISKDTWNLSQARRKKGRKYSFRSTKQEYLLGRRIRCACGHSITGSSTPRGKGKYSKYYKCSSSSRHIRYDGSPCGLPYFRSEDVDAITWKWVRSLLLDPDKLQQGYDLALNESTSIHEGLNDQIATLDKEQANLSNQHQRLLKLYAIEDIEIDELRESLKDTTDRLQAIKEQQLEIQQQLSEPLPSPDYLASIQKFARKLASNLNQNLSFPQRRQIIEDLDVTVTLEYKEEARIIHASCNLLNLHFTHTHTV